VILEIKVLQEAVGLQESVELILLQVRMGIREILKSLARAVEVEGAQ
jgi:hypothetical protein